MKSYAGEMRHPRVRMALQAATLCVALLGTEQIAAAATEDMTVMACGALENAYGPYDYTDAVHRRDNLPIVEQFHFTPSVENLTQARSGTIIGDLDYTLRAFPNHHLALDAMARYQLLHPQSVGTEFRTADCYFDRAMRWRPNDAAVYQIYGIYLTRKGDKQGALTRYQEALKLDPESAETHYNIGLLYFDLKQMDQAREHAVKAYQLGYPLPGLRNRLVRAGAWKMSATDSPAPAPTAPAPGAEKSATGAVPPG